MLKDYDQSQPGAILLQECDACAACVSVGISGAPLGCR